MSNHSSPQVHGLVGKKRPVAPNWKKRRKEKSRLLREARHKKLAETGIVFN